MSIIKELLLMESNYQDVGEGRYFVARNDYCEIVLDHLIFHPLSTESYFHKRNGTDLYDFEIEFSVDAKVNTLKGMHMASAIADISLEVTVEGSSGKISIKRKPSVESIVKYRRFSHQAPRDEADDDKLNLRDMIDEALLSNPVYLKTAMMRALTHGENNWRTFINARIEEIKQDEADEMEASKPLDWGPDDD